jgi:riboflavin transporter FmnP
MSEMDSKKISIIAIFTALAIVLNMSPIKIPAPYAPFLFYQIWEIPIVTVTLLYGFYIGIIISVINTLILLIVFPGALPTGPIYNLIAILSMILGIYFNIKYIVARFEKQQETITTVFSTTIGIIMRVLVMTIVNWVFLSYPPPVGFSMPQEAITPLIPLIAFFNATLALYTIPIGYTLNREVRKRVALFHKASQN